MHRNKIRHFLKSAKEMIDVALENDTFDQELFEDTLSLIRKAYDLWKKEEEQAIKSLLKQVGG